MANLFVPSNAAPGVYTITVTATDGNGQQAMTTFTLTISGTSPIVTPIYSLKIPDIFSEHELLTLTVVADSLDEQTQQQQFINLSDPTIEPELGGSQICWDDLTADELDALTNEQLDEFASNACIGTAQACWDSLTADELDALTNAQLDAMASSACV